MTPPEVCTYTNMVLLCVTLTLESIIVFQVTVTHALRPAIVPCTYRHIYIYYIAQKLDQYDTNVTA